MNKTDKQEFIKKKIVDALFACLENKQIEEMTTDEIAQRADVSKRTLYKYYSSKKEMYLAVVKESFKELSSIIQSNIDIVEDDDPWVFIACIGREYMKYFFNNTIKGQLILNFNEMAYIDKYEKWVTEIQEYSNKFELTPYVKNYYEYHNVRPHTNIKTISLYIWAEAQGIIQLIMSKGDWLKEFYEIEVDELIEEHLVLSKKVLGEVK